MLPFLRSWLFWILLMTISVSSYAKQIDSDSYKVISKEAQSLLMENNGKKVITGFFSYACPHCSSFEPILDKWSIINKDVVINKIPVEFGRSQWKVIAKAYYIALALDKEKILSPLIFKAIHKQNLDIMSQNKLKKFFIKNGVSAEQFDQLYNSFSIEQQLRNNKALIQAVGLMGVPAIIVDGKYLVSPTSAKSLPNMLTVASQLMQKNNIIYKLLKTIPKRMENSKA